MRKIGIFGGTFDPPHIGHFIIAEEVCEQCDLDEVWFMPVNIPPHKQRIDLTPADKRIKMLELGIKDHNKFSICSLEVNREGKSYTVDTMKQLRQQFPNDKFYFIIGGDMVGNLHEWHEIDKLMELVTFIGTKRPGHLEISKVAEDEMIFVTVPQLEISSSMIRERIAHNKSINYYVPDKVGEYIKENQLYGAK